MFDCFDLPEWFDVSIEIQNKLIKFWNKSYSELYDERFFGESKLTEGELEKDIYDLLLLCNDKNHQRFNPRLLYINWALCIASKPVIDIHSKGRFDITEFNYILKELEIWQIYKHFSSEFLEYELEIEKYFYGSIIESVLVYKNIVEIVESNKNAIDIVADSIDMCIDGKAIVTGYEDKRAIFNWILTNVFPASYYLKLPDFTYTYKFRLPSNWTYHKY